MAHAQIVKLEEPYFYPKSQATAKIINVPDYKVVNLSYLAKHASKSGYRRDRLPLYTLLQFRNNQVNPFSGQRFKPLPPVLFDLIGQPAGWGIPVADAFARGKALNESFISPHDNVLQGYRHITIDITVDWPCFLKQYPPFKMQFTVRESTKTRYHMAHMAAQTIVAFLNTSSQWAVDSEHQYWAPDSSTRLEQGINAYNLRLVALVNTHENDWRCDIAIVRPLGNIPSNCIPTMEDPPQYRFF